MKKSILKILILLITLTGFFSCQEPENEIIDSVSVESSNYEFKIVDGSEIKRITYALNNILDGKLSSRDIGDPIFDMGNILALKDSTNNTNYTFNFILPNRPVNERYNLVVGVDSLGRVAEPKVLRYVSNETNLENWIENDYRFSSFQGQIHLHNYTDYFNSFGITGNGTCSDYDENGDPIPCDSEDVDNTGGSDGTGGGGGPGEGTGDGANDSSGSDSSGVTGSGGGCWVSVEWDGCGGTNTNVPHGPGPGSCGGDGTGAGYVVHIDCPGFHETYSRDGDCQDCDSGTSGPSGTNNINTSVEKLNYYLGNTLTSIQIENLIDQPSFVGYLNSHLKESGYSSESFELVRWALKVFDFQYTIPCKDENNDCIESLRVMAEGLKKFHGEDGSLLAELIDNFIADLEEFTVEDVQDFYDWVKQITLDLNNHMFDSITHPYIEISLLFVEYAVFNGVFQYGSKLLGLMPLRWVTRGGNLTTFVLQVARLGVKGTSNSIRIVSTTNPVGRARGLFTSMTRDAISITEAQGGTLIANMGNGSTITFRTLSKTGAEATIDLNFPSLFSTVRKIKFVSP